jgi:phenylacetate-CoA ligase
MNPAAHENASPEAIAARQIARLRRLLDNLLPHNRFYAAKLGERASVSGWDDYRALPFTTKAEIVADQEAAPPYGTVATYPRER